MGLTEFLGRFDSSLNLIILILLTVDPRWLKDKNIKLLFSSRMCNFSRINPLALDLMEPSVKQNVMTPSVLLKSSNQLYSIRLHYIKSPLKDSTDCLLGALSRSVSS